MTDKRKKRIRELRAELKIPYQAADNLLKAEALKAAAAAATASAEPAEPILDEERLRDPTAIISAGLKTILGRAWPGLRVGISRGGLFGGNAPVPATGRVFNSHAVIANVPIVNAQIQVRIEVRTGERRRGTSVFRAWVWIGDRAHPVLDQPVDLLDGAAVSEFLAEILEAVEVHVPNSAPLVPGQQLRRAVEIWWFRLGSADERVTLQAASLRQDDRIPPSGKVAMIRTLPVVFGAVRKVDSADGPVACRAYEGPLVVDNTDVSWANATARGLVPWLRQELGDYCIDVELLGPHQHNRVNVRALFRVPRAA